MEAQFLQDHSPIVTTPKQAQALVEVEQQRAMAEVQSAIIIAKRFPRNRIEARDRILTACQQPKLAEQALYSYARGGSDITGPSIRLAEAVAQGWGNIQFGIRELEQRGGESTVEAFAWDMETNVRQTKTFQVKHERHTRKGKYALEDPRDIYETIANQGARRLRACILGIIPADVIDDAVAQCEQTLNAKADTSAEALKKLVDAFEKHGVSKAQIEKRIQRRLDAITPAQIINLRKIYNSLKDNMSSPADWFEPDGEVSEGDIGKGTEGVKEKLKAKKDNGEVRKTVGLFDCPDTGEKINAGKCEGCGKREGCPAWE